MESKKNLVILVEAEKNPCSLTIFTSPIIIQKLFLTYFKAILVKKCWMINIGLIPLERHNSTLCPSTKLHRDFSFKLPNLLYLARFSYSEWFFLIGFSKWPNIILIRNKMAKRCIFSCSILQKEASRVLIMFICWKKS